VKKCRSLLKTSYASHVNIAIIMNVDKFVRSARRGEITAQASTQRGQRDRRAVRERGQDALAEA
jgi:hypothetical protein